MAELVGLISASADILNGIVKVIDQATQAWDRTKNGKKYLDNVVIQVKITREILQKIVVGENNQHSSEVHQAVELVNNKAKELDTAVQSLTKSSEEGSMRVFLDEFFRGNARAKRFDKLQRDLYHAQTILITALVASKVNNTNFFHINIKTIDQVKECFVRCHGINCAPPIVQLLQEKGTPVGDGSELWQVSAEDLEAFINEQQSSEPKTVRIMENNNLTDFSMMTAEVGAPGQAAPPVDEVWAVGNTLSGSAMVIAGPITYETSTQMQMVRASLDHVRQEPQLAFSILAQVMPGLKPPREH
ncbi:hypothetical protein F4823DRAFT_614100 [Ustulina deusta]|nr:hypothetical protein F4823DRAFT_614100 [Ustulina deusta]